MPTYEYRCNYCGHEFEQYQSMKDSPLKKCPSCGKLKLERLIGTGAAVIFKGSGFYETDYRSESYKKAAEADKPEPKPDAKPEGKPDAKADAKPETKAEAAKPEAKPESKPEPAKASRTAAKATAKPASKPKPRAKAAKKR